MTSTLTRPRGSTGLRAALTVSLLLLSAMASAQEITFNTGGIISVANGIAPIYNGQYFLQRTDFGFLWLDTVALQPGIVQVEAKCGLGQPRPTTNIYVIGDCNGITSVSSFGNVVLARQFNGQCGAAVDGCGGPRTTGVGMFKFALGSWDYLGMTDEDIPDSTQTTDLLGRTWKVVVNSLSSVTFVASGNTNPSAPPTAIAAATNLSAGARADKTNYYGDKWQLKDSSASATSLTRIDWDLLYSGSFSPDEVGTPTAEGTVAGYFPCNPTAPAAGTFRTGTGCLGSLGIGGNPAGTNVYQFAMQSANANGTSANVFVSPFIQAECPQASIANFSNFTGSCDKAGGTLYVMVGGNADASGSSGNTLEAAFDWSFTGRSTIAVQGQTVPVPSGSSAFSLTITYPGGYKATAQGNIIRVQDQENANGPRISIAPAPFCSTVCALEVGTTYLLWNSNAAIVNGHLAYWDLDGSPIGVSAGAGGFLSWTPTEACSSCTLRVTVNGASATLSITVSDAEDPPPPPSTTPPPPPAPTPPPNPWARR